MWFFFICFSLIRSHISDTQRRLQMQAVIAALAADVQNAGSASGYTVVDAAYKDALKQLKTGYALQQDKSQLDQYKQQITRLEYRAHNIIPVSSPTVLTDLSLSFTNPQPNGIILLGTKLYITGSDSLYVVDSNSVSSGSKVDSQYVTAPVAVSALDDGDAVVYDKNNGILQLDINGNVTQIPGLSDIKNVNSIATFQGNIYLLDNQDQVVYKSMKIGDGYSLANAYITDANLDQATAIAVDGNVFVASPLQGILRYFSGKSTPFTIGKLDMIGPSLGPITYIFDNEHLNNLYVLDPQNKRILVLQKPTGSDTVTYQYVKQYIYTGSKDLFGNLSAIAIDTAEENMYVLSGSKVLKFSL